MQMVGVNVGVDLTLSSQSPGEPSIDRTSMGVSPLMGCSHFENIATGGADWLVGSSSAIWSTAYPVGAWESARMVGSANSMESPQPCMAGRKAEEVLRVLVPEAVHGS